jgi:hypothetical protein
MPLGYEVFAGNRTDVTTLQEIVQTMERRYGRTDRIWVGDRGMVSADNIAFLKQSGRRYIVGTSKSILKQFERALLLEDWHSIRDGLEVKLCPSPARRRDVRALPQSRPSRKGKGHAQPFRAADRGRIATHRGLLRKATSTAAGGGAAIGTIDGPQQSRGGSGHPACAFETQLAIATSNGRYIVSVAEKIFRQFGAIELDKK